MRETFPSVDRQCMLAQGAQAVGDRGVDQGDGAALGGGEVLVRIKTEADSVIRIANFFALILSADRVCRVFHNKKIMFFCNLHNFIMSHIWP